MSRRNNRSNRPSRYFSTTLNHAGMQPRTQDARPEPKPMPLRPPLAGQRDAVGLAMIDEAGRWASSEEHQHAAKGASNHMIGLATGQTGPAKCPEAGQSTAT